VPAPVRAEVFLAQARAAAGRSPLYDALWRRLADEPLVDELVDEYRWDTPLKVVGGLHYLVLDGRAAWDDVEEALVGEREFLRRYVAEQGIQTNEVQRCWALLPCLLEVARRTGADRFDFVELGPSAGLNLVWDRYRYRYANGSWGDPQARLELAGEERTPIPAGLLALAPRVRSRVGIDLAPIDATTDEGVRLLKSFVWPDMTDRFERLERAIDVLRADPPKLVRGDLVERLPELLAGDGTPTVVVDTAVLGYVPAASRRRVYDSFAAAGARGPLAYVRTRQPAPEVHTYWALELQLWPGGEREVVAYVDFHGAWIDWLAEVDRSPQPPA
jgi:hypothetical protein